MTCSGPVLAQRDDLRVTDCRECGYPHLEKFPSQAELDKYYAESFWQSTKSGWREIHEAQRDWLDARNGDYLALVERHTQGRSLLDVGCGWGFFLKSALSRGWSVSGIEPSAESAEYAQSLIGNWHILKTGWESARFSLHHESWSSDCISALWLIEHLPNPLEFLQWCKSHLTDGGVLLLALPSEWSDLQYRANQVAANNYYFVHHTHLNYFSQAHISNLLGLAGFRIVEWSATYPMERFILSGLDYADDQLIGSRCHDVVRAVEMAMTREERLALYADYARCGIGRDMIVVAK